MKRYLAGLSLWALSLSSSLAQPFDITPRQVVDMPANAATALRGEMVDMLGNLGKAQSLSAEGKYFEAAEHIEKTMGLSAMGNHGAGVRPGMFMPSGMRVMAQGLHKSASDWANAVRTLDRKQADAALTTVLGTCAVCHQSFQLRRLP